MILSIHFSSTYLVNLIFVPPNQKEKISSKSFKNGPIQAIHELMTSLSSVSIHTIENTDMCHYKLPSYFFSFGYHEETINL